MLWLDRRCSSLAEDPGVPPMLLRASVKCLGGLCIGRLRHRSDRMGVQRYRELAPEPMHVDNKSARNLARHCPRARN
jgi:hypothetical protein